MAAGRDERRSRRSESQNVDEDMDIEEEEPDFRDPSDFVDDITDEGMMFDIKRWFLETSR